MSGEWVSGDFNLDDVKKAVDNLKVFPIDMHSFHESPSGPLTFVDLPTLDFPAGGKIKCFVDLVSDVDIEVPKAVIKEGFQSKTYEDIPAPFGMKSKITGPFKLDIAIMLQQNGKHTVIKLFHFPQLMKVDAARDLCYGTPYCFNWQGEVKTMKKCIHFVFERLGGFQCRQHVFRQSEEGKPESERSQEEWDFGFDFIELNGPRENIKNRMLRWVTVQTSNKDSPIFRWPPVLVEKSLRNLAQDGVLAQVHTSWCLTLYDIDVRVLKALAPLFSSFSEKALGLFGEPGAGKTPVARSVAMALSRYYINRIGKQGEVEPSFRQASEFDFFRGQSGQILRPDIFDDGTLPEQPFKKLKAFTDVGNIESMSKERWGAAKWVKGQPRIYCVNDYDRKAEPKNDLPILSHRQGIISYATHGDFLNMLEPAWCPKDKNEANVMAVLKRTHILLKTKTFLYVRPASEKESPVLRIPLDDKLDLLHLESRSVYDYHRKGGTNMPADFDSKVAWETEWVEKAMKGNISGLKYRPTIIRKNIFADHVESHPQPRLDLSHALVRNVSNLFETPNPSSSARPHADKSTGADVEPKPATHTSTCSDAQPLKKVKLEPGIFRTLTSSEVGGTTIDLDSSPEKPPRPSVVEESLTQQLEEQMRQAEIPNPGSPEFPCGDEAGDAHDEEDQLSFGGDAMDVAEDIH
ncbi:unnamed protein product [Symbiodinium sp. CCMP2592]|nr:unnamed protein product [Symbiodinium sp. CCMP2592]